MGKDVSIVQATQFVVLYDGSPRKLVQSPLVTNIPEGNQTRVIGKSDHALLPPTNLEDDTGQTVHPFNIQQVPAEPLLCARPGSRCVGGISDQKRHTGPCPGEGERPLGRTNSNKGISGHLHGG